MAEDIYRRTLAALEDDGHDPSKTLEEAELALPNYLTGTKDLWEKRRSLMRVLAANLTDDRREGHHTAMVNLLIKLFEGWSWQQVCDFGTQSIPYEDGLAFGEGMVPFNRLMMTLLGKATGSPVDAAHAAGMLGTMQALVRLWLCTADTGVATQASKLLLDLLKVDAPSQGQMEWRVPAGGGQGLVWKRIFGDRDVYLVFFEACSLETETGLSKSEKTIAQARLMEWLPKVGAMNWGAVARGHHADIESRFGVQGGGLLDFAALKMVDYKDDVLMHRCLVDFYADLLHATRRMDTHTMHQHDSVGLQYVIMRGLHPRIAAIYLQLPHPDPVEAMFLYGSAANYIATYVSEYPQHYLASQMPKQVNVRLLHTLNLSAGRWAHAESPKHDLHVAASLPRKALLRNSADWSSSPLSLIPSKATNPGALNTLATVFHGPERKAVIYPPTSAMNNNGTADAAFAEEAAAARALYFNYLAHNPRFWQDITIHADTVALKDLALAALTCLTSVITATWSTKPDFPLPSTIATPESGHLAILSPPALEYTLPYLLKPAQTFANLVGGRGDTESAAYRIAAAKFDALKALNSRLMVQVQQQPGEGYEEILATISKRLAQGPMSREGEVGGRVAAMEM